MYLPHFSSDSLFLGGSVERMVVQHPLNDTDNSLFLWTTLQHKDTTHLILLSTLPNDSKAQNELLFVPRFSYIPPGSVEFLQFRSVVLSRKQAAALGNSDEANDEESSRDSNSSFSIRESGRFNQLMIFLYTERFNNSFALKAGQFIFCPTVVILFCLGERFRLGWILLPKNAERGSRRSHARSTMRLSFTLSSRKAVV